jgi:hypothetical protein
MDTETHVHERTKVHIHHPPKLTLRENLLASLEQTTPWSPLEILLTLAGISHIQPPSLHVWC